MAQSQRSRPPAPGTPRWLAAALVALLAGAGLLFTAAPASAAGTLSLYKAIENLATGASEGDRTKWGVQAVNLETGETIRADGLNGFQSRNIPSGQYRISEYNTDRTPPGYRFRDWNCNGTIYTDPEPVITLGENQNLTCTVTNVAVQSTLTVVKEVEGGSADPALWTLRAMDGPTYVGGPANSPQVTSVPVRSGTYRLDESGGPEAYENGECEYEDHLGNTGSLPVNQNNQIHIALDQQVTCTVVNTSDTTELTLAKELGDAAGPLHDPSDFTLTAASETGTISGPSGSLDVSHVEVEPGEEYELSEDGPAGYQSQGWACEAEEGEFALNDDIVTLTSGADVTCTVTNEFTGGWLTLAKEVENSTQPASNWELSAVGPDGASGTELEGTSGSGAVTQVPVPAGDYDLTEEWEGEGPDGYLTDGFVCDDDSAGYSVTVESGEEVTCTITNRRDPDITQLTLAKQVDNTGGGPLTATAWGLRAEHEDGPAISGLTGQSTITYRLVNPGTFGLLEEDRPAAGAPEQFAMYENGGPAPILRATSSTSSIPRWTSRKVPRSTVPCRTPGPDRVSASAKPLNLIMAFIPPLIGS